MSRRLEDELPALVYFLVVYYNILCVCVCSINGARRIRKKYSVEHASWTTAADVSTAPAAKGYKVMAGPASQQQPRAVPCVRKEPRRERESRGQLGKRCFNGIKVITISQNEPRAAFSFFSPSPCVVPNERRSQFTGR